MGRRLLAGLYPNGLGEHVEGNGFLSGLKLAIAAKTAHVLQGSLLGAGSRLLEYEYCLREVTRRKYVEGFRLVLKIGVARKPTTALGTKVCSRQIWKASCTLLQ
jgi:hypothetical protein